MKKIISYLLIATSLLIFSCKKDSLPSNPTIVSPISGLILTVHGLDYTAIPTLDASNNLTDTLIVNVKVPDSVAKVKQFSALDKNATSSVSAGSMLLFVNNVSTITVKNGDGSTHSYYLKMTFTPPPAKYILLYAHDHPESDPIDPSKAQTISSVNADGKYEGYVVIGNPWWNFYIIGSVSPEMYYGISNGGGAFPLSDADSSGSATLDVLQPSYPDGPWPSDPPNWTGWGDGSTWWKVNFDTASSLLSLQKVVFSVVGPATGGATQVMTAPDYVYSSASKLWSITTDLSAGDFQFSARDGAIVYGDAGTTDNLTGILASNGAAISVPTAGNYTILLNLSSGYYSYTITKN